MFAYKISWILLLFVVVLLLALIVFLAGIETATDNKVSNYMITDDIAK